LGGHRNAAELLAGGRRDRAAENLVGRLRGSYQAQRGHCGCTRQQHATHFRHEVFSRRESETPYQRPAGAAETGMVMINETTSSMSELVSAYLQPGIFTRPVSMTWCISFGSPFAAALFSGGP